MIENQGYLFLVYTINGILIGILFDIFRILRRTFQTKDVITYLQDILFWILTGLLLLYTIFTFSNGEIRLYMFLGVFIGCLLYMILISKYFIKINVKIVLFLKNIIGTIISILIFPIKFIFKIIKKILFKPIHFITINTKKIPHMQFEFLKNTSKNRKNKIKT